MKKTLLFASLLFSTLISKTISAQELIPSEDKLDILPAQVLREGNFIVEPYLGFPNLYSAVFRATYANSGSEQNVSIRGIGPIGLRGEYMITDQLGLGLDIGFNNSKISYDELVSEYNNATGITETKIYRYDFSTKKVGVIVNFNYHFIENEKIDFYGTFGAGYGRRTFDYTSTDQNYEPSKITGLFPVASRIGIGVRYFFSPNIGVNLAAGVGQGGLLNGGLSFKF
jgi:hypothetical protein